jgi:hypothetical protein
MIERILVRDNIQGEGIPGVVLCTDLASGNDETLRYWPTHRGEDGPVPNPACKMEAGRCYRVGLRHSSRVGYPDEWMVREAEEIPPETPPAKPTRELYILAETCLKEAGESLRNDQTINGGPYGTKAHLETTEKLLSGMMQMLAEKAKENK